MDMQMFLQLETFKHIQARIGYGQTLNEIRT